MAGEFEKLLPFKWRDEEYPLSNIRFSLAHDLVEHKYWSVDGGRIEDTGVAPIRITASIPLVNHIFPGQNEKWKPGQLYPTALRKLFVDFGKKTTALLQHPEFGRIPCKAERIDCNLTSDRRGHAQIEASWIETIDDNVRAVPRLNPINNLASAVGDLDASDADLRALAPQIPEYEESFEDMMRAVQAVGDQVSLVSQRAGGRIDAIVYRAKQVQQSVDRARSALTWPVTQNIERVKEAAQGLREQLLASSRSIGIYAVTNATTLAGVLAQLPSNTGIADVIKLNPRLVAAPVIPEATAVRYYLVAA